MPQWTCIPVLPGDRVTIEVQHSNRPALQPLIGVLRTVEVLDHSRAVILNEDSTRYRVNGRRLPPVALVEVSIFTDPTGGLWAQTYELPPRQHSPYPAAAALRVVAEPDDRGGIARMRSCWCGAGCLCPTCGEQTIMIPTNSGLDWSGHSLTGRTHSQRWCAPSSCAGAAAARLPDGPDCCAMPMMLAPVAWVCRRESVHQRPYQWPA